jgi:hypothetical protein
MISIANHVRIFDSQPADDLVVKRTAAIKLLEATYGKGRAVPATLQSANDIAHAVDAKGCFTRELAAEIEAAIRKSADAFVGEGEELQMLVCAMLAALQVLDGAPGSTSVLTSTDVFAIGLWSALSFQNLGRSRNSKHCAPP